MMIDKATTLAITNPHTQASGIYQIPYLTEYANLEPIAKSMMEDPIRAGTFFNSAINRETLDPYTPPGDTVGQACLYLAISCFTRKTEDIYKQIIDKVLDTYDIWIHGSRIAKEQARVRTKELLKDLVSIIIDNYYDLFNKIAEELNLC